VAQLSYNLAERWSCSYLCIPPLTSSQRWLLTQFIWDLTKRSSLDIHWRFRWLYCVHREDKKLSLDKSLISCLTYNWTLKRETVWFSETSVELYWTRRRHSLQHSTILDIKRFSF
jgi:hypothetical protein